MNNSKTYNIFLRYIDGETDNVTITTDNIEWSIDQFIRNRKTFSELNVELKENGKEGKRTLSK